jgi:hypothetical protein
VVAAGAAVIGYSGLSSAHDAARPAAGAPPVAIRVLPVHQHDSIAAKRVTAQVRLRRGRGMRVQVVARVVRAGAAPVPLGPARSVTLGRARARTVNLPVDATGAAALADCAAGRVEVVVSRGASRSASTRLRLDPPNCARFFSPKSFWNEQIPAGAALDPDSAPITAHLLKEVSHGYSGGMPPTINTTSYSPPIYTVAADQPTVRVALDRDGYAPDLESAFAAVPLPDDARTAQGTDAELVVWQPATDTLWEFWRLRRSDDGVWKAAWGGRLEHVSSSAGVYLAPNEHWGSTASSLSLAGGLITPGELKNGVIDHALAMAVPNARSGQYALPAQRTDGTSSCASAVPEGARFQLDPSLNIDALGLPAPVATLAHAAQRYGIVVRDQAAAVVFYAQNPVSIGSDPYPALFGGASAPDLLRSFPWDRLQLLRMDLRDSPGHGSGILPPILDGC